MKTKHFSCLLIWIFKSIEIGDIKLNNLFLEESNAQNDENEFWKFQISSELTEHENRQRLNESVKLELDKQIKQKQEKRLTKNLSKDCFHGRIEFESETKNNESSKRSYKYELDELLAGKEAEKRSTDWKNKISELKFVVERKNNEKYVQDMIKSIEILWNGFCWRDRKE